MSEQPVMVPNPLKAELRAAVRLARAVAEDCERALDAAKRAMWGGAWRSSVADGYFGELNAADRDSARIAADCVASLEGAESAAPAEVELGVPSWQYRPAGY